MPDARDDSPADTATDGLPAGFSHRRQTIEAVDGPLTPAYSIGGEGPPLLLLHGYPETRVTWHRVAPTLARHFTLVMPDLRGYGDSDAPESPDGARYAKAIMARDMIVLMAAVGALGHGAGGRQWPFHPRGGPGGRYYRLSGVFRRHRGCPVMNWR